MNDRREKKTRQAIYTALQTLLARKEYNRITVQDIIQEADIGRSTFYNHFETKDEVLRALCADIFAHVFAWDASPIQDAVPMPSRTLRDKLIHILSHFQDKKTMIQPILRSDGQSAFMKYFKRYMATILRIYLAAPVHPVPEDFLLSQSVSGLANALQWWLTAHDTYSPADITDFYLSAYNARLFMEDPFRSRSQPHP